MKPLKILVVNLLIFGVLFAAVEGVLRWQAPDYAYYYQTHPAQPDLVEVLARCTATWPRPDADLGWTIRPQETLDFPSPPRTGVRYDINAEGFRMPFDLTDSIAEEKRRVLLLGDSFLFGIYLNEAATVTAQLRDTLGEEFVFYPIAVPAWGLDQMYLAYQKYVDVIRPDQVILTFIDDDLMRSLEILYHGVGRKPRLKIADGQLVPNHDNPARWETICWNNQIGNRLLRAHHERRAAELGAFMLRDIAQRERAAGRTLSVVRIPARVDLDAGEARPIFDLGEAVTAQGGQYRALFEPFSREDYADYYIPDDGHFTEAGVERLVEELIPVLSSH